IADESGQITAVWFNQAWLADKLKPGTHVRLRGHLRRNEFNVRSYDLNGASATADFPPVYPATEDLTVKKLRDVIRRALTQARRPGRPTPRTRSRPGLPTPCLPAQPLSRLCTSRAPPRTPRSGAGGSRSRSCSCSRSAWPAGAVGVSTKRRLRSASPVS